MKHRVRAIIEKDGKLLLIKRVKDAGTHWVFPGGGVDDGESHKQALIRECKEELGVDVSIGKLVFENVLDLAGFEQQKEFFYICEIIGGRIGTGEGPEFQPDSIYEGTHELIWVSISELENLKIRPTEIKNIFKDNNLF